MVFKCKRICFQPRQWVLSQYPVDPTWFPGWQSEIQILPDSGGPGKHSSHSFPKVPTRLSGSGKGAEEPLQAPASAQLSPLGVLCCGFQLSSQQTQFCPPDRKPGSVGFHAQRQEPFQTLLTQWQSPSHQLPSHRSPT